MPEMNFTVEWPDGSLQECYSPSLVMHDHLAVGESYPVADFVNRAAAALDEASRRVQQKYGFACTSAQAQRDDILERAQHYTGRPNQPLARAAGSGMVRVLSMQPPLPASNPQ